jgi:hypothetical protein
MRADHTQGSVESGKPVGNSAQAGSPIWIGPTATVVTNDHAKHLSSVLDPDPRLAGLAVFDDVGYCFGHREIHSRLDRIRQPAPWQVHAHLDVYRHRDDQSPDGPYESPVGQHRRMDASHQVPQVGESGTSRGSCLGQ